ESLVRLVVPPRSTWLALLLLLAVASASAQTAPLESAPPRRQPHVLFLAVDDFTRPYVRLLFDGVNDAFAQTVDPPAIYFESLDASRFDDRRHLDGLRGWFEHKYADQHVDLVLAIGEDALAFLADGEGGPWPRAAILYLESGGVRADIRA